MRQREGWRSVRERRGAATTDAALRLLDDLTDRGRPVFLWVHYGTPTDPYVPPKASARARSTTNDRRPTACASFPSPRLSGDGALPRYQDVDGQRQVAFYRAGYNGEVAVVDEAIGRSSTASRGEGFSTTPRS